MYRPIRISTLKSGDLFYEESGGHYLKLTALEDARENETGWSLKTVSTLGERELFEVNGGRPLRIYIDSK